MDENEDSALPRRSQRPPRDSATSSGRTKNSAPDEELTAWFEQELTTLPGHMEPRAALQLLLTDLEKVNRLFRLNGHAGYVAALKAVIRACHALGYGELAVPFLILGKDLSDTYQGLPTYALRVGPRAKGNPKSTVEWDITVEACACLDVLVKDTRMDLNDAANAVTTVLRKRGVELGRKSTSIALKNVRNEISRGQKVPDYVKVRFPHSTSNLQGVAPASPPDERRGELLRCLDQFLVTYFAISDQVPFSSKREGA